MRLPLGRMAVYLRYFVYIATRIAITSDKQSQKDNL